MPFDMWHEVLHNEQQRFNGTLKKSSNTYTNKTCSLTKLFVCEKLEGVGFNACEYAQKVVRYPIESLLFSCVILVTRPHPK